jgi:hypothetical protein
MVWIYKKTVYVYFLLDTIIPLFYQATYVFLSHVMTLTSMWLFISISLLLRLARWLAQIVVARFDVDRVVSYCYHNADI